MRRDGVVPFPLKVVAADVDGGPMGLQQPRETGAGEVAALVGFEDLRPAVAGQGVLHVPDSRIVQRAL